MILPGAEPFFLPGGSHGVLLVHGFTGLPAELLLMGQFLNAKGFTVLGVRLAGHGTTAEDMSHTTAEDWFDSVRDGYALLTGAAKKISVIGHSMGGLLALMLAMEEDIERVITLAAPIFISEELNIRLLPPREEVSGVFYPKARRKLKNVPAAVNNTYRKMPLVCVHELLDVIAKVKINLAAVTSPTLIMHSDNDKTLSSRDNISLYVSEYDGSALEELSGSIVSYRWVGKNQFLYTEFDGKNLSYFAYDTVKKQKILVKTVEQEVDEKQIYM